MSTLSNAGVITALTMPTGVTINSARPPRYVVWGREVIVVNASSVPVAVNRLNQVRVAVPHAPSNAPTLSATGTGLLSGTFKVKATFRIKDSYGNLLAESGFGPVSAVSSALVLQYLKADNIPISTQTVSSRMLYRTLTGPGEVYFPWIEVDGNTQTTIQNDLTDLSLSTLAAEDLGDIPDLDLIAEFKDRLWGRARLDIDTIRYTESGTSYAWRPENLIPIPKLGGDDRGVIQIVARKEGLGVGKQNTLHQITGNSSKDFRRATVSDFIGFEAPEAVLSYHDHVYFLWKDGVYEWSDGAIICISDNKVRSWFTKDDTFNRARFKYARMTIDPNRNTLILLLAAAGSSSEDRWVEFDLTDKTWWGPHKTGEFTPTALTYIYDANELAIPVFGSSNGFVWKPTTTRTDGTATAVDFDVDTKFHDDGSPDIEKFWDQPAFLYKIQGASTLTVTPYVGGLDAAAGTAISVDQVLGRTRADRLGVGRFLKFNFRQNTAGVDVELYGFEVPFFEVGRR